jgi:hypothetical protein
MLDSRLIRYPFSAAATARLVSYDFDVVCNSSLRLPKLENQLKIISSLE